MAQYFWAISTFFGIIVLCLCSIIEGTTVFGAVYSFNFNKSYQKFTLCSKIIYQKWFCFCLSQLSAFLSGTCLFLSESSCIYLILSASHRRMKSSHTWNLDEFLQLLILIPQTLVKEPKIILNVQSASVRGSLQSWTRMRPWKQQQKQEPLHRCWNLSIPATSMRQTVITSAAEAVS